MNDDVSGRAQPFQTLPSARTIELRLLGPPEVLADGAPVAIERRKALALLAYLAMEPGEHARDALAALLAPDDEPATARAGLRRALAVLAPIFRPWIHINGDRLALIRDAAFTFDVERFRGHLLAGSRDDLRAAVALYRGDFLAGFSLPGSAPFEEWQLFETERLRQELAGALDRLSALPEAAGDLEAAIGYARRWLALDPLHEPAHRRLMQLYAAAGQRTAALRQYRLLADTLERELGAAPDPATHALYEEIRQGDRAPQASRWSSAPPRLPAAPGLAAAIETPTLPFLGREEELQRIAEALDDPACRILTLIGPGGMGKTRLAIQAAQQHAARFPDGVYQISLVGVSSGERLITAIGATLGVTGQGDALERLCAALYDRAVLLVLDNLDQAVEGAALLRTLVHRTRRLKLLVTSRERLKLQEEWVIDLAGLAVPEEDDATRDPATYPAVQLFALRARQVRADFELTPEDLPAVVEICRLVEGMPLAIELAAAWVRVLTPAEIARELTQSMALLTTTLLDVPERHRSVEGVFTQTWERLSATEQQALRQLAVFEDGFTRVAATDVAGASPLVLAALTDKALIRRDRTGRYAIHELLRQFAARKLAADPAEERATMLRLVRFYARLLERRNQDLQGAHQRQALVELDREYDNLWKAWTWAVAELCLEELALALDGFYRLHEVRGWYSDGIEALEALIERLEHAPPEGAPAAERAVLLARARARAGALYCWIGEFAAAEQHLEAALPVLRAHDQALDVAYTLTGLGIVASERDEEQRARRLLEEGLAAYQALGHQPGVAWALDALGDLAGSEGDYARARDLLTESSTLFSAMGDQVSAAWSLCSLGRVLGLMGDHAAARQLLNESLIIFESLDDRHGAAAAHANLAEGAYAARDLAAARQHWLASLRLAREVGVAPYVMDALAGLATVLSETGAPEQAHELAALATAHPATWRETLDAARAVLAATSAALDPATAAQAERRGRATPWEVAVARVLEETT